MGLCDGGVDDNRYDLRQQFRRRVRGKGILVSGDPSAVFLGTGVWDCFKLDLVAVLLETNGVMKIGCGRQANAP